MTAQSTSLMQVTSKAATAARHSFDDGDKGVDAICAQQRRKEQNRRAQANLRRKRQEQVEDLEQQIYCLKQEIVCLRSRTGKVAAVHSLPQTDSAFLSAPLTDLAFPSAYDENFDFGFSGLDTGLLDTVSLPLEADVALNNHLNQHPHPKSTHVDRDCMNHTPWTSSARISGIPSHSPCGPWTPITLPLSSFDCMAQNAKLIGITPEEFLSTHSTSPFYHPFRKCIITSPDICRLPLMLHPTLAQLSYPHLAWIDCIPNPDLRSRIIFGSAHRPPLLDCLDLWHDILTGGDACAGHDTEETRMSLSPYFLDRWQMLLKMDLSQLQKMCLASNPPLTLVDMAGP